MIQNKDPMMSLTLEQLFTRKEKISILSIPSFQRNYSWDKEQIIDFLEDISSDYKEYTSKVISKSNNDDQKNSLFGLVFGHLEDNIFSINDGQQRFTTFILLIFALHIINGKTNLWLEKFNKSGDPLLQGENHYLKRIYQIFTVDHLNHNHVYDTIYNSEHSLDILSKSKLFNALLLIIDILDDSGETLKSLKESYDEAHKSLDKEKQKLLKKVSIKSNYKEAGVVEDIVSNIVDRKEYRKLRDWDGNKLDILLNYLTNDCVIEFYSFIDAEISKIAFVRMNARGKELTFYEMLKHKYSSKNNEITNIIDGYLISDHDYYCFEGINLDESKRIVAIEKAHKECVKVYHNFKSNDNIKLFKLYSEYISSDTNHEHINPLTLETHMRNNFNVKGISKHEYLEYHSSFIKKFISLDSKQPKLNDVELSNDIFTDYHLMKRILKFISRDEYVSLLCFNAIQKPKYEKENNKLIMMNSIGSSFVGQSDDINKAKGKFDSESLNFNKIRREIVTKNIDAKVSYQNLQYFKPGLQISTKDIKGWIKISASTKKKMLEKLFEFYCDELNKLS